MKKSLDEIKIMFVAPKMNTGGIEKVFLSLLQEFSKKKIDCSLALVKNEGTLLEEAKKITKLHFFDSNNVFFFVPDLVKILKEERPTHVISAFEDVGFLTFLALKIARIDCKWIHSVHNTHKLIGRPKKIKKSMLYIIENILGRFYYHYADKIVAVSEGVRQEVINDYKVDSDKVVKIYNPVVKDSELNYIRYPLMGSEVLNLISVGRLHYQKGYDFLIGSLKELKGNWKLSIWGSGPERNNLLALISRLNLEDKVELMGYTNAPLEKMKNADVFILSSRFEGLGNVLIEAMAVQCQLIATDCRHGPSELLENGRLGQLIPVGDKEAMLTAINNVFGRKFYVSEDELRKSAYKYTVSSSAEKWLELID